MTEGNVVVRQADLKDLDRIVEVNNLAWGPGLESSHQDFIERFKAFSEGEIGAYVNGKLVGIISSLIIRSESADDVPSTWAEVSGNGQIGSAHNPSGNSLVCFSVGVAPEARGLNIGKFLVKAQAELARRLQLKRVYAYSRPSSYRYFKKKFHPEMTDEEFLKQVTIKEYLGRGRDGKPREDGERLFDLAIGMHVSNGAEIVRVIPRGRVEDSEAYGYNVLLEYKLD